MVESITELRPKHWPRSWHATLSRNLGIDVSSGKRCGWLCPVRRSRLQKAKRRMGASRGSAEAHEGQSVRGWDHALSHVRGLCHGQAARPSQAGTFSGGRKRESGNREREQARKTGELEKETQRETEQKTKEIENKRRREKDIDRTREREREKRVGKRRYSTTSIDVRRNVIESVEQCRKVTKRTES